MTDAEHPSLIKGRWDTERFQWICEVCGEKGENHALANYCRACGGLFDSKSQTITIGDGETRAATRNRVTLRAADMLIDAFSTTIVVDSSNGNFEVFPTTIGSHSFALPSLQRSLKKVCYDSWWIYALDHKGLIMAYPLSALHSTESTNENNWTCLKEDVDDLLPTVGCLYVKHSDQRRLVSLAPMVPRDYWSSGQAVLSEETVLESDFDVKSVVPMSSTSSRLLIVGEKSAQVWGSEGLAGSYQGFPGADFTEWVGSSRAGLSQAMGLRKDGVVHGFSFLEGGGFVPTEVSVDRTSSIKGVNVGRETWFVLVSPTSINLIDPIQCDRVVAKRDDILSRVDLTATFANVLVALQQQPGHDSKLQCSIFGFSESGVISRPRVWFVDGSPVCAPAAFGTTAHLLVEDAGSIWLESYPLN